MVYVPQPDITLSQANPVSGMLYPVFDANDNIEITGIIVSVTWAVTQPNPLTLVLTVDGIVKTVPFTNPVSAVQHGVFLHMVAASGLRLEAVDTGASGKNVTPYLYKCRSGKVEVSVTWAVTQPDPLTCRVKWAQLQ
jgi:hypothetical protein